MHWQIGKLSRMLLSVSSVGYFRAGRRRQLPDSDLYLEATAVLAVVTSSLSLAVPGELSTLAKADYVAPGSSPFSCVYALQFMCRCTVISASKQVVTTAQYTAFHKL